eukprot:gene9164-16293_t
MMSVMVKAERPPEENETELVIYVDGVTAAGLTTRLELFVKGSSFFQTMFEDVAGNSSSGGGGGGDGLAGKSSSHSTLQLEPSKEDTIPAWRELLAMLNNSNLQLIHTESLSLILPLMEKYNFTGCGLLARVKRFFLQRTGQLSLHDSAMVIHMLESAPALILKSTILRDGLKAAKDYRKQREEERMKMIACSLDGIADIMAVHTIVALLVVVMGITVVVVVVMGLWRQRKIQVAFEDYVNKVIFWKACEDNVQHDKAEEDALVEHIKNVCKGTFCTKHFKFFRDWCNEPHPDEFNKWHQWLDWSFRCQEYPLDHDLIDSHSKTEEARALADEANAAVEEASSLEHQDHTKAFTTGKSAVLHLLGLRLAQHPHLGTTPWPAAWTVGTSASTPWHYTLACGLHSGHISVHTLALHLGLRLAQWAHQRLHLGTTPWPAACTAGTSASTPWHYTLACGLACGLHSGHISVHTLALHLGLQLGLRLAQRAHQRPHLGTTPWPAACTAGTSATTLWHYTLACGLACGLHSGHISVHTLALHLGLRLGLRLAQRAHQRPHLGTTPWPAACTVGTSASTPWHYTLALHLGTTPWPAACTAGTSATTLWHYTLACGLACGLHSGHISVHTLALHFGLRLGLWLAQRAHQRPHLGTTPWPAAWLAACRAGTSASTPWHYTLACGLHSGHISVHT